MKMRRLFTLFSLLLLVSISNAQQTGSLVAAKTTPADKDTAGYRIPVTVTPYKNCKLYLGSYYGKYKNLVDSTLVNEKSSGIFQGKQKLPQGIYFIVSPDHIILFELFMDARQHFSIKADSSDYNNVVITGSWENSLFHEYTVFLAKRIPDVTALQESLKKAASREDSLRINKQLDHANKVISDYRDTIIRKYPESMLALFFEAVKRPELPKIKMTRAAEAYYLKEHYWDDVYFNDPRLLHTPFFDPKLEEYYKYYVSQEPDSIIPEVNYMLLSARTNPDMFRYLLGKFTDKYINPEIMGQDKVFIFLFNNFYARGDTAWLTPEQRKYIFDRAYSLIANQIGEPAPVLDLVDTSGAPVSLYQVSAPFTVVVFWDPNCSHCQKEIPVMDSMYEAKWKKEGIKIFAVNVADAAVNDWKRFIVAHHLNGWIHAYQTTEQEHAEEAAKQANYRQLYDVFQTPTVYLLDSAKHIIAKRLSLEQFDRLIDAKREKPVSATKE